MLSWETEIESLDFYRAQIMATTVVNGYTVRVKRFVKFAYLNEVTCEDEITVRDGKGQILLIGKGDTSEHKTTDIMDLLHDISEDSHNWPMEEECRERISQGLAERIDGLWEEVAEIKEKKIIIDGLPNEQNAILRRLTVGIKQFDDNLDSNHLLFLGLVDNSGEIEGTRYTLALTEQGKRYCLAWGIN